MERLTKINEYGAIEPTYALKSLEEDNDWSAECREKLAYYEDLEEIGKLIITPYKLNDTIYIIGDNDKIEEAIVDGFEIRRLRDGFELFVLIPIYDDIRQVGCKTILNDGVFLTREDAEEKLKEMK